MANWHDNIPAPVDANGREVPLDTRELVLDGKVFEVGGLAYRNVECSWVADLVGFASKIPLDYCALRESWEQLEEDARKTPREYIEGRCIPVGRDGRVVAMACDLVRRAKALAGVAE